MTNRSNYFGNKNKTMTKRAYDKSFKWRLTNHSNTKRPKPRKPMTKRANYDKLFKNKEQMSIRIKT